MSAQRLRPSIVPQAGRPQARRSQTGTGRDGHERVLVVRQRRAQSRHHLAIHQVPGVALQTRKMWKAIGKVCEWKHPRAPSVRLLWDRRAMEAV